MRLKTFLGLNGFSIKTANKSGRLSRLFFALILFLIASIFLTFTEQSFLGRLIDVYLLLLAGLFLIFRFVIMRSVNLKTKIENSNLGRFLWGFSYIYLYAIVILVFFYGL